MLVRLRSFLGAWTRRDRFEDALDDEVRFHLEAFTEELVRAGVPRHEAACRARVEFGSIQSAKDDCRGARGLRLADELERTMANIRLGFRMLFKTPLVTGVAIAGRDRGRPRRERPVADHRRRGAGGVPRHDVQHADRVLRADHDARPAVA